MRKGLGFYFLVSGFVFLCAAACLGNPQRPPEATARVPALEDFHEVIFKIWHEAWPNKDAAMLRELLPQVEQGISTIASAELPGILREKKRAWQEAVKSLQNAGLDYRAAVAAKDDNALLAAAEALHNRFERLVRAIRPLVKELDDFHAVLYMLYHYYLPNRELQKIRSSASELKQKMDALNLIRLPDHLKAKEAEFQAARMRLSKSVDALVLSSRSDDVTTLRNAIEEVHSNYRALDELLD